MSTPTNEPPTEEKGPSGTTFALSDTAANWVIGVVTVMWALNIIAGMVQFNDYQPSDMVHGAFMIIVGGAFTLRIRGS